MYNVLKPVYHEAGLDNKGNMQYTVSWKVLGKAKNMQDAKRLHPAPVLEQI